MFNTLIYTPLYNGLILLMDLLPWADVGVVIILFTIFVKLILLPLSTKSVKTQATLKQIQPELKKIQETYKDDRQKQGERIMALYKENNINPFSGFLLLFIQIPIIFGLYFVFLRGGLPDIHTDILYSFVGIPDMVNMIFLGIVDISQRNIVLAIITGVTQFIHIRLSMPAVAERKNQASFKDDMMRSMQLQMRYVMPGIIFFVAWSLPAAVALYWTASNLFLIGQEMLINRKYKNVEAKEVVA